MKTKEFRKDINGLRAIAVLAVVIFHYNNNWLTGGFSGVDVFFVISGFLMTKIIYKGLVENKFSLYIFLRNRFNRTIPALTIVILIALSLGYIFLEPLSYKIAGEHALSSLLLYSNFVYQNELGYFDIDSINKLFLHTWSLSIEWQFYVIYPVLLMALFKLTSKLNVKKTILIFTIILFFINLIISYLYPEKSYFMLLARSWEMLLGGVAYLYPYKKRNKGIQLVGLSLIIFGYIFLDSSMIWPSFYALVPVIGVYLIIFQMKERSILDNSFFQLTGTASYSIYLVHWPIIVFSKKMSFNINLIEYFLLIGVFSFIMYFFVEKKRNYKFKLISLFVMVIFISYLIKIDGVRSRIQNKDYTLSIDEFRGRYEGHLGVSDNENEIYFNSNKNDFDYILIGDSHAKHLYHYINLSGLKVASLALDDCMSTENFYTKYNGDNCSGRYNKAIEFISKNPNKKIIWSALWLRKGERESRNGMVGFDLESELELFIRKIKDENLYLIGSTPNSGYVIYECLAKKNLLINKLINLTNCPNIIPYKESHIDNALISLSKKHSNVYFIKASSAICNANNCMIMTNNNEPLFTDTHHLTKLGSEIVGEYIFKKINNE